MTLIIEPMPFRSLRMLTASIATHEQMLRQAPEGSEERWRIECKLAALGRQLDEAEGVWAGYNQIKRGALG
jgi:hypothetical protein